MLWQGGPDSWLVEVFAKVAKRPAALAGAQVWIVKTAIEEHRQKVW
jgi:hypothetical protein